MNKTLKVAIFYTHTHTDVLEDKRMRGGLACH